MRILLTGAGGQVGTDLIPLLIARGHKVAGFDTVKAPTSMPPGAEWFVGDVTYEGEVNDVVRQYRPESIWHLAAILSATGEKIPHKAWRVNMEGTRLLLEAARLFGARQFLFTSTIAAFGPGLAEPVGNDVSMRPTTMYGLTKVAGELLGEYYKTKWKLDFRGVRFPGLISAVEPGGGTSDYVNYMYFDGIRKGAYEAFVRDDSTIPLMYMPDALRALVELAEAPIESLRHSMYNIAAMSPRADEIAAAVAKRIPGVALTFKSDKVRQAILDSWPKKLDDAEARRDWGWRPQYDLGAMSDDLVAKVRAMYGIKAGAAAPVARPPSGSAPSPRPTFTVPAANVAPEPAAPKPASKPAATATPPAAVAPAAAPASAVALPTVPSPTVPSPTVPAPKAAAPKAVTPKPVTPKPAAVKSVAPKAVVAAPAAKPTVKPAAKAPAKPAPKAIAKKK
jgi:threonine 3-dehydrogenase